MTRYLEYVYLLAGVGIAVFMALNFKDLELGNKILLSFGAILSSFMFSFRRKQRQMLEELDARDAQAEADEAENAQESEDHDH
jgi:hypothetical protein